MTYTAPFEFPRACTVHRAPHGYVLTRNQRYSDVNCPDFDTHAHAQSFFKGTGGTTSNDPYGLDRDHDGIACETLP